MTLERQSAILDTLPRIGDKIALAVHRNPVLYQLVAWPEGLAAIAEQAAELAGCATAAAPGRAVIGTHAGLLRVAPLKWWLIGAPAPPLPVNAGASLDLSHAYTCIHLTGAASASLLNRHISIDLRPAQFTSGRVATTLWHGSAVTLWRNEDDWRLFIPRSFARDLVTMLAISAEQWLPDADWQDELSD